jgi:hypothetical protein
MNQHEILQSLFAQQRWNLVAAEMEQGMNFTRGAKSSGIDVAAFLDDLAADYPLSVRS